MKHFSQQELHLKKNWGNTYRANLRAAVEALPKFVPMPPLSILRALPSVPLDSAEYNKLRDEMQAAFDEANEAIDSIRAAVVLLQATADYEFETEAEEHVIARFLERTGQYVTNDASREAAIAEALQKAFTREFANELGNTIRITIEGPTSISENTLTPMEAGQLRSALNEHAALASPKEAQATPQAALSALQIADCVTAVRHYSVALATVPAEELIAFVRNIEAALTQPTTVQQAEPSADGHGYIVQALAHAWQAGRDGNPYPGVASDKRAKQAYEEGESARRSAALKGMQPGERKEQS